MKRISSIITLMYVIGCLQVSSQDNTLTVNEKVYGLSRIWNEAKFNFTYFNYLPTLNIDSLYREFIDKVTISDDNISYYQTLQKFTSCFMDNHTYVMYPENLSKLLYGRSFTDYKIELSYIEDKIIVSRIGLKNKNELPIGSEVTHVDFIPASLYLEERVYPFINSSSMHRKKHLGVEDLLIGLEGTSTTITCILPDGTSKEFELKRGRNNDEWFLGSEKMFYLSFEPNISYIRVNTFSDWSLADTLLRYIDIIRTSNALIIDIRGNGGGSSIIAKDIAKYFIKDSLVIGSLVKARINISSQRARGISLTKIDTLNNDVNKTNYLIANNLFLFPIGTSSFSNDLAESQKVTDIPIVILVNAVNISAAEEFLVYFDSQNNITLIGEETGGGNGQPMIISLPGGGHAAICTQYCSYPDGREYYRNGIKPDIHVIQTIKDLINGKDTSLESALKFLRNKLE
jgi:C-terminal processing protease CtpA/Prc